MGTLAITNIGKIFSGDARKGILQGDTIFVRDGLIAKIGRQSEIDVKAADDIIDVVGLTITPGLIDPHTHPAIGDWTPRQKALDWMEGAFHGGVTSMVSQGAVHVQGRPTDPVGIKCLAILGAKTSQNFRPGGFLKAHHGTVILESGLTEQDFKEMAENGVQNVAEIGGSGLYKPADVKDMVAWARKYGMTVPMHFGGESVPGSARVWSDMVLEVKPDVVVHLNGGSTSAPWDEIKKIIEQSDFPVEVIYNGNPKRMYQIVKLLKERNELHRLVMGSDSPIGIGMIPTAIIRCITQVASLNEIPAETAVAAATGTTADIYKLNTGKVEVGREADLLVMGTPKDSIGKDAKEALEVGDTPAIGVMIVDGKIAALKARNTNQLTTVVKINGKEVGSPGLHEYFFGTKSKLS